MHNADDLLEGLQCQRRGGKMVTPVTSLLPGNAGDQSPSTSSACTRAVRFGEAGT